MKVKAESLECRVITGVGNTFFGWLGEGRAFLKIRFTTFPRDSKTFLNCLKHETVQSIIRPLLTKRDPEINLRHLEKKSRQFDNKCT